MNERKVIRTVGHGMQDIRVYSDGSAWLTDDDGRVVSDCAYAEEPGGAFTDLSDTLACLRHFADRAGIGWEEVLAHADRAYVGDAEDAPHLAHDVDRFPGA